MIFNIFLLYRLIAFSLNSSEYTYNPVELDFTETDYIDLSMDADSSNTCSINNSTHGCDVHKIDYEKNFVIIPMYLLIFLLLYVLLATVFCGL